jgi:hypothetical protein
MQDVLALRSLRRQDDEVVRRLGDPRLNQGPDGIVAEQFFEGAQNLERIRPSGVELRANRDFATSDS